MPGTPPNERLPPASTVPTAAEGLERTAHFSGTVIRRYEQEIAYTTAEYLDLLCTYSNHRALAERQRTDLLRCIAKRIDQHHGGRIAKRYLNELAVTYRRGH